MERILMCKESKIHFFTNPPYITTFLNDWVEQIKVSRKQLRCQHLLSLRESMQQACKCIQDKGRNPFYCQQEWVHTLC